MIEAVIEKWHQHMRGQFPGGLDELLADDVVFFSPIVYTPQEGKAITKLYLEAAGQTLPGDKAAGGGDGGSGGGFRYTKEVLAGDTAVLEFETTVKGKYVNGVDIIRCDDEGRIVEFRVMIRPLQAVNLVHEQMRAMLETMQASDGSPTEHAGDNAMTERVGFVVTDLDGTLWEDADAVHPRTRQAVADLAVLGVPLLVATGRRVASTRAPLAALGLAPPAIVLNGALGLDLATGRRFHHGGFPLADALLVLEVFGRWEVDPCVYVDGEGPSVWVSHAPSTHPQHLASFGDDVATGTLDTVVGSEPVLAFGVLGIEERVAVGLGAELASVATAHVDRDRGYGGYTVTVAPARQSKWDGVAAFCREQGIAAGAVLAIGDGPNDVELLDHAAVAVVPEDAHVEARTRADHVVGLAADGGWGDILELLGR